MAGVLVTDWEGESESRERGGGGRGEERREDTYVHTSK